VCIKNKSDIINYIIKQHDYRSYLEIGVHRGANYTKIKATIKASVDPESKYPATYPITSDEYFRRHLCMMKETGVPFKGFGFHYDVVFIDGMHLAEFAIRDIENSLTFLTPYYIVVHDCNPTTEAMQKRKRPPLPDPWTGDVWKGWVHLKKKRDDLFMFVVDVDYGVGIIVKGNQKQLHIPGPLSWKLLEERRKYLLNLKDIEYFKKFVRKQSGTIRTGKHDRN